MPAWCTITEVEYELSVDGLTGTTNDNQNNRVADPVIVASAIEIAQQQLSQYLIQKYDIATITSSNLWIKWATATFAAVELLRRKGGGLPPGLAEKYDELKDFLHGVQTGSLIVPGLATRRIGAMAISNLTMDRGFGRSKIRRVPSISYPTSGSTLPTFNDRYDFGQTQ